MLAFWHSSSHLVVILKDFQIQFFSLPIQKCVMKNEVVVTTLFRLCQKVWNRLTLTTCNMSFNI